MRAKTVWRIKKSLILGHLFTPFIFDQKTPEFKQLFGHLLTSFLCTLQPPNSWMKERNQPWPKRAKNEWVNRCETEMFLRNSSTNFTWSSIPGASVPYVILEAIYGALHAPLEVTNEALLMSFWKQHMEHSIWDTFTRNGTQCKICRRIPQKHFNLTPINPLILSPFGPGLVSFFHSRVGGL